jgi:hypothetical protein
MLVRSGGGGTCSVGGLRGGGGLLGRSGGGGTCSVGGLRGGGGLLGRSGGGTLSRAGGGGDSQIASHHMFVGPVKCYERGNTSGFLNSILGRQGCPAADMWHGSTCFMSVQHWQKGTQEQRGSGTRESRHCMGWFGVGWGALSLFSLTGEVGRAALAVVRLLAAGAWNGTLPSW